MSREYLEINPDNSHVSWEEVLDSLGYREGSGETEFLRENGRRMMERIARANQNNIEPVKKEALLQESSDPVEYEPGRLHGLASDLEEAGYIDIDRKGRVKMAETTYPQELYIKADSIGAERLDKNLEQDSIDVYDLKYGFRSIPNEKRQKIVGLSLEVATFLANNYVNSEKEMLEKFERSRHTHATDKELISSRDVLKDFRMVRSDGEKGIMFDEDYLDILHQGVDEYLRGE